MSEQDDKTAVDAATRLGAEHAKKLAEPLVGAMLESHRQTRQEAYLEGYAAGRAQGKAGVDAELIANLRWWIPVLEARSEEGLAAIIEAAADALAAAQESRWLDIESAPKDRNQHGKVEIGDSGKYPKNPKPVAPAPEECTMKNDPLTVDQHLLCCLAEEAAEIVQAVNKALRFGLDDDYKGPGADSPSNLYPPREYIIREVADLYGVVELLQERGVLLMVLQPQIVAKKEKLKHFIEYAKEQGTVIDSVAPADAVHEEHCWHCGVVLESRSRPRCATCPDECDVEDCDAFGCSDRGTP